MNRIPFGSIVLLSLLGACSSQSDLSPSDPMNTGGASDGGTVSACSRCFTEGCAWEASECASDPECAGWLSCARQCPDDGAGNPSASCMGVCPNPDSTTGMTLRDVLVGCLGASSGCCGGSSVPEGGTGGSGAGGMAGNGVEDAGTDAPVCEADGCEACLAAVKEQKECAASDPSCATAVSDCLHDDTCWTFLTSYAECARSEAPAAASCAYEVPDESLNVSAGAMACAATYCPTCIPNPDRLCVACQLASCPDEMAALLSSLEAQQLLWCREACQGAEDTVACNQSCVASHEGGKNALVELYVCSQSACKQACAP